VQRGARKQCKKGAHCHGQGKEIVSSQKKFLLQKSTQNGYIISKDGGSVKSGADVGKRPLHFLRKCHGLTKGFQDMFAPVDDLGKASFSVLCCFIWLLPGQTGGQYGPFLTGELEQKLLFAGRIYASAQIVKHLQDKKGRF
jgi:hypothetical protein